MRLALPTSLSPLFFFFFLLLLLLLLLPSNQIIFCHNYLNFELHSGFGRQRMLQSWMSRGLETKSILLCMQASYCSSIRFSLSDPLIFFLFEGFLISTSAY